MKRSFSTLLLLTLLTAVFLGATVINNLYLKNINIDLTKGNIYSLSLGSENIASNIAANVNASITLYLIYSNQTSKGMTTIRDYKSRVESLLKEYQQLSNGKIKLEFIDPIPFSEDEDKAASFELIAMPTGVQGNTVYFGLVGINSLGDTSVISYFDPQKEPFLEFEISSLLYQLNNPEPTNLTIVSDLPVAGGLHPVTGEEIPEYALLKKLKTIFDVTLIDSAQVSIPNNTEVLFLWHPQNINQTLLFSIDQFLMSGGKTLALLDAHYESGLLPSGAAGVNSSSLELLASYGIIFDSSQVVIDALTGLDVGSPQEGFTRHLAYLGLIRGQINEKDVTTIDLDSINGASFGTVSKGKTGTLSQTILLRSSRQSNLVPTSTYTSIQDPAVLAKEYTPGGKEYTLAARFSGAASSHFADQQINVPITFIPSTPNLNIVVVADADLAEDKFWVKQTNLYGKMELTPFANNGDFIINTLEHLSGSQDLIDIRSRGTYTRPFTRVQEIQAIAEEKFKEQKQSLQEQLAKTEAQLIQLQTQSDSQALTLEQEAAVETFTKESMKIRKLIRDVQFQRQKDIDELGSTLKFLNVVVAPMIIVVMLFFLSRLFRKRAPKQT